MNRKNPRLGWIDRTFVQLVEKLAADAGYLDVWSADKVSLRAICRQAQKLLDEIVKADEEYLETNLDKEAVDALECYRLNVSMALNETRGKLLAHNKDSASRIMIACQSGRPLSQDIVKLKVGLNPKGPRRRRSSLDNESSAAQALPLTKTADED